MGTLVAVGSLARFTGPLWGKALVTACIMSDIGVFAHLISSDMPILFLACRKCCLHFC